MIYEKIYNIIKQSFIFFSWNFPVTLIIQKKHIATGTGITCLNH